jgi:hypothetical protein
MDRIRSAGRWLMDRVAPLPARLALNLLYFAAVVPYGFVWRCLRRAEPSRDSNWRPCERTSDTLSKARLRY